MDQFRGAVLNKLAARHSLIQTLAAARLASGHGAMDSYLNATVHPRPQTKLVLMLDRFVVRTLPIQINLTPGTDQSTLIMAEEQQNPETAPLVADDNVRTRCGSGAS